MNTGFYLAFPLVVLLLVLQMSLSPHVAILGVVPQLLFLVTIPWGLFYGLQQGLLLAFFSGFLIDLYSAGPLGASSLALMAAVTAAVILRRFLPENRFIVPALLGASATLVFWIVYILLLRILVPIMVDSLQFLSVSGLAGNPRAQGLISDIASGYGLGGTTGNLILRKIAMIDCLVDPAIIRVHAFRRNADVGPVESIR